MPPLSELVLLPRPRRIADAAGRCAAGTAAPPEVDEGLPSQGYRIVITNDTIRVASRDAAGSHYAAMTLRQLRRVCDGPLPCGVIEDGPDFPVRGVMLDISRDKVPTMETLYRLVDEFSEWKINRLELYTEHTFAYRNHREVWERADPMTAEQVRALDAYCRERFMELVPNQNCFGHLARWLKHPRYRDLAETPDGHMAWGEWRPYPFSLNPLDPRSRELVAELLAELLPNFSSRHVNVGCDETVDLGQGRSKDACTRRGKGRVYLDFLRRIHAEAARHGRTMNFWGDIILHHPELIAELPRDAVALVWGYEADHPFDRECAAFVASGLPFLVCPGTSTWNALTGRTTNMLGNVRQAAEAGLRHGAGGLIVTDWGDNGHWQPLVFSYPGLAAAAAMAWCGQSNPPGGVCRQVDTQILRDRGGIAGRIIRALGDVHRLLSLQQPNATPLFWLLRRDDIGSLADKLPPDELHAVRASVRELAASLPGARMERDDADLLRDEAQLGATMLDLACRRGLRQVVAPGEWHELVESMRAVWLRRNRPGGLADSLAPLTGRAT